MIGKFLEQLHRRGTVCLVAGEKFWWWWWWWWRFFFAEQLIDEICLALFYTRTIFRDHHIVNLRHDASRIWTRAKPEFRLCWMKLCNSDNYYTNTSLFCKHLAKRYNYTDNKDNEDVYYWYNRINEGMYKFQYWISLKHKASANQVPCCVVSANMNINM